jgi:hypothetical protein
MSSDSVSGGNLRVVDGKDNGVAFRAAGLRDGAKDSQPVAGAAPNREVRVKHPDLAHPGRYDPQYTCFENEIRADELNTAPPKKTEPKKIPQL